MIFHRGQQVTLLVRDWQISIHFACFCFWMTVTIMIDGSVKRNHKFGLNFVVRMLLKNAINSKIILSDFFCLWKKICSHLYTEDDHPFHYK